MNNATNFHRAFGVYGICIENKNLLVIDKIKGPYRNRYDLPGGSLEDGESLLGGLHREIKEETGLNVTVVKQVGTIDFQFPSKFKEYTHVHHIAVFYFVERCEGEFKVLEQFEEQDSLGARWIPIESITEGNSSPLVCSAVEWLKESKFRLEVKAYKSWVIK
ncbi:NUDIX hydrolase [Bacillus paramobilis]|uniref:NUDIX hydrolase n=1 Tax=Bacillus paramobilis TaxID=2817477 RepID=A0ABZ2VVC4_9BACI|nr:MULTISPECIES: NUDIX domain-containing protein [Bacillus]AYF06993.1 NUDIX domain-containing protein [Bacillus mobilis]PDZ69308.1 NUDIX domain-containing protein [Bacillus cereus]PER25960.1 NUDIX domain-containing protein [Bacillus cereus]PEU73047.1 NUDIX domain-containing protein [Bacillus cereus]PGT67499.1 NUDIX domain-containing protein [Bacillus cereus]